jgi:hypothetical protein
MRQALQGAISAEKAAHTQNVTRFSLDEVCRMVGKGEYLPWGAIINVHLGDMREAGEIIRLAQKPHPPTSDAILFHRQND